MAQTFGETSATCEEYEAHQSTCCPSEVKVPCSICPNGVDAGSLLEAGDYNETVAEALAARCQESIAYHAQFDAESFECAYDTSSPSSDPTQSFLHKPVM